MSDTCDLCNRELKLTEHHLIPKTRQSNKKVKRDKTKEELTKTCWVCRDCHDQIHALINEKELASNYNTLEKLRCHPGLIEFVKWIRKQNRKIKVKRSW